MSDLSLKARSGALLRAHQIKVRFAAAGVLNTIMGFGVFPSLMLVFGPRGLNYMVAFVLAYLINVGFAFFTTKLLVFRTVGNYWAEFVKFGGFHVFFFCANAIVLPVLVELLRFKPIPSQFFFSLGAMVTSYFWHSRVTFRVQEPRP